MIHRKSQFIRLEETSTSSSRQTDFNCFVFKTVFAPIDSALDCVVASTSTGSIYILDPNTCQKISSIAGSSIYHILNCVDTKTDNCLANTSTIVVVNSKLYNQ
jgi:hypothetical protein